MFKPTAKIKNILSNVGLFYAAAIWGSTFYIVKSVLDDVDPVVLVGYRFLLAGLILLGYLIFRRANVLKFFVIPRETTGPPSLNDVYVIAKCFCSSSHIILGSSRPHVSSLDPWSASSVGS